MALRRLANGRHPYPEEILRMMTGHDIVPGVRRGPNDGGRIGDE